MNDILKERIQERKNKMIKINYEFSSKTSSDDFLDEDTSPSIVPSDPKGPKPKISGEQKTQSYQTLIFIDEVIILIVYEQYINIFIFSIP